MERFGRTKSDDTPWEYLDDIAWYTAPGTAQPEHLQTKGK